jgi:hypothetical protein
MKIRLHGTPAEVEIVANLLRQFETEQDAFEIVAESDDYPDRPRRGEAEDRSKLVRRYLEIRL